MPARHGKNSHLISRFENEEVFENTEGVLDMIKINFKIKF
jgi:hypothetical protein